MTNSFCISAADGFGIVEQTFVRGEDVPTETNAARQEVLSYHRVNLVQIAFLTEPRLQEAGGLRTVPFTDVADVVFEEVWPVLGTDQERASYTLNSVQSEGELLVYRDVTFLFSGLGWDRSPDFALWRLPNVEDASWPAVTSSATGDPTA